MLTRVLISIIIVIITVHTKVWQIFKFDLIVGENMKDIVWYFETGFNPVKILPAEVLTCVGVYFAIELVLYLFRSIGLYTLAKKQGTKKAWLSFIPLLWLYVAGKVMGMIVIGGKPYKGFALLATIVFSVSEVIALAVNFIAYFPLVGYYLQGGEVYFANEEIYNESLKAMGFSPYYFSYYTVFVRGIVYPYPNLQAMNVVLTVLDLVNSFLSLISICLTILVFMGLFRKFYPEHYILATVLSAIGLFPIMVFVVRNKKAINFNDYIRSRYYGHGYNPYAGSNTGNSQENTFANGSSSGRQEKPESPFEEFENRKEEDDPFGFDNK